MSEQLPIPPLSPKKSGVNPKDDPELANPAAYENDEEVIMSVWQGEGEERGKIRKKFKIHKSEWRGDSNSGQRLYQLLDDGNIYKEDGNSWFPENRIKYP
ncbi:hypothetical protein SLS58_008636 [Diplodia intermedia]|uniref:Uncharacterized protein n=1 Tax=Diplodia intermedia TaxID=856260 RepID=A0ABR3TGT7_9PEZI